MSTRRSWFRVPPRGVILLAAGALAIVLVAPVRADPINYSRELMERAPFSFLVAGKVIDTKGTPDDKLASRVKVTSVYVGPRDLVGRVFLDTTTSSPPFSGEENYPEYAEGEVGIWILRKEDEGWTAVARAREKHHPRYKANVEWAEAAEALDKLPDRWRAVRARQLCRHKTREVAQYAVGVVAAEMTKASYEFLQVLATDPAVSVSTLIAADRWLVDRWEKEWVDSAHRDEFWKRWGDPLTDEEAVEVGYHLGRLCGSWPKRITAERAAVLIAGHIAAPGRSKDARVSLIGALSVVATRGRVVDPVFVALGQVLTTERDEEIREAAAKSLPSLVDLSPPRLELPMALSPVQLRAVADLLRVEKNPKVVPYLQKTIGKMNTAAKP